MPKESSARGHWPGLDPKRALYATPSPGPSGPVTFISDGLLALEAVDDHSYQSYETLCSVAPLSG